MRMNGAHARTAPTRALAIGGQCLHEHLYRIPCVGRYQLHRHAFCRLLQDLPRCKANRHPLPMCEPVVA
jgi:hypothetical protein